MTAQQLIDEAAQKGIKLWWEPFDRAPTRSELVKANSYLTKIANAALVERNYYIELLTNALERSEVIQNAVKENKPQEELQNA